jgi:Ca2+-binding RTX toxin-like protein
MRFVAVLMLLGVLAGAPAALASTVSTGLFQAAPGEANDVHIDSYHFPPTATDLGAPLVAGPGCQQTVPITCDYFGSQRVYLGDRNDKAASVTVVESKVYGEQGNDFIGSSGEHGWADGGSGADTIWATGNASIAYGGPGPDHIQGGGLDEAVMYGEDGNDVLTQTNLSRGCGSSMDGGRGADRLLGYACTRLIGGPGRDALIVYLSGPRGFDRAAKLDGGPGGDFVVGGLGSDQIDAGPGRDFIQAAVDGVADTVVCGTGEDTIRADPLDTVAADCEHVTIIGA